jgi:hypothetical protein
MAHGFTSQGPGGRDNPPFAPLVNRTGEPGSALMAAIRRNISTNGDLIRFSIGTPLKLLPAGHFQSYTDKCLKSPLSLGIVRWGIQTRCIDKSRNINTIFVLSVGKLYQT